MRAAVRDPILVGTAALVLYLSTLYPDLPGGDAPELIAAAATGGVIHPPGYPLYALLARLFLLVPHGTLAWRVNLLSAVCDAAAAALLYCAVARATASRRAAFVAAALFAAAPGIWRYAIAAEVFALNNLFVVALLLLAVVHAERRDRRSLCAGAFVLGLGLSNHHTVVFTGIPLAAWAGWTDRRDLARWPTAALVILCFAAGLLPYAALPLSDSTHAAVSWGATNTWRGFWTHVLRREYGTFQLGATGVAGPGDPAATVAAWANDLVRQVGWWGLALATVGAVACARVPGVRLSGLGRVVLLPPLLVVTVMTLLGNLPVSDALHRAIVERFWQQSTIYACAWCGLGIAVLEQRLPGWAATSLAAVVSLVPVAVRFPAMDHHRARLVATYGMEILRAAPRDALLLTRGDLITNTVRYQQVAEGLRADVRVVDLEVLGFPWEVERVRACHPEVIVPGARYMPGAADGFTLAALLDANAGHGRAPVLLCGGAKPGDRSADPTYGMWPYGFCELVHRGDEPVNLDDWIAESEHALPRLDLGPHPPVEDAWEVVVWGDAWEVRNARAAQLLRVAGADPARRGYVTSAARMLEDLVAADPDVPVHVWRNLATALGRSGLETDEDRRRAADAWRHWLALAPKDDPQRAVIEEEMRRLEPAR